MEYKDYDESIILEDAMKRGCVSVLLLLASIALAAVLLMLTGCKTIEQSTQEEKGDSVRVEIRERIVKVTDTVTVEVPGISQERLTKDSISRLENDWAVSVARVSRNGVLWHTLDVKPRKIEMAAEHAVTAKDSIVYRDRWRQKTVTKTVTKNRLTWIQKAQVYGFRAMLTVALLFVVWRWARRRGLFQYKR